MKTSDARDLLTFKLPSVLFVYHITRTNKYIIMSEYDNLRKSKLKLKTSIKKPKSIKPKRQKVKEEQAGGSSVKDEATEDAEDHGGWWKVDKYEQIKGDVVIEFLSGCYAKALNNGSIVLGNPHPPGEGPDEEEIFTAVCAGTNQIALKSGFDRYWSVDSRNRVMGLSEAISELETFLPVFEDDNTALCAFNDRFLSPDQTVETNQQILATAEKAGPHEMIKIRIDHNPYLGLRNKETRPEDLGTIYDAELNHLKKYQSHGSKHFLGNDKKNLKKAKVEGQLYEALLDKRTKHKSDKYCK